MALALEVGDARARTMTQSTTGELCALGHPQRVFGGSNDHFWVVTWIGRSSEATREGPRAPTHRGLTWPKGMAAEAGTALHNRNHPRLEKSPQSIACGLIIPVCSQRLQKPPRVCCFHVFHPQLARVVRYEAKSRLAVSSSRNHANNRVGWVVSATGDRIILDSRSVQFLQLNSAVNGKLGC